MNLRNDPYYLMLVLSKWFQSCTFILNKLLYLNRWNVRYRKREDEKKEEQEVGVSKGWKKKDDKS